MKETVSLSGIWLRKAGEKVQVLVESKGIHGTHWFLVIDEHESGNFSHIAEPQGILNSPVDPWEEIIEAGKLSQVPAPAATDEEK